MREERDWGKIARIVTAVAFAVFVLAYMLRIDRTVKDFLQDPFGLGIRAIDTVNVGTGPNTGTGDPLRTAFLKVNRLIVMMDSLGIDDLTADYVTTLAAVAEIADTTEVAVSLTEYEANMGNYLMRELRAMGSTAIGLPVGAYQPMTTNKALTDATAFWQAFYLPLADTITGVKFVQRTQGGYTAADTNCVALYSVSGATYTKVATSANNGNLWKGTSYSLQTVAFTSAYVAAAGLYYVCFTYNQSAETTAPSIYCWNSSSTVSQLLTDSHRISGTVGTMTGPPTTEGRSDLTAADVIYGIWLY